MHADFQDLKKQLLALGRDHSVAAHKYCFLCEEYGKVISIHQKYLAERIMVYKENKKNIGVDMAILFALADDNWSSKMLFIKINERLNEMDYLRKGMERVLDAYKSEIIAIQGLLRMESEGEKYYGNQ
jgi:hypothetical protein